MRFLRRHRRALAERSVWLFQSGPLDDTADKGAIPLPGRVARLSEAIGVRGHATFGGRLGPDAKGLIARKMAEGGQGGDFRDFDRIRSWAEGIARGLSSRAPAG